MEDFFNTFDGTWMHWWLEVKIDNKIYIVDTTVDQFYPGKEKDYRIVIDLKKNLKHLYN